MELTVNQIYFKVIHLGGRGNQKTVLIPTMEIVERREGGKEEMKNGRKEL